MNGIKIYPRKKWMGTKIIKISHSFLRLKLQKPINQINGIFICILWKFKISRYNFCKCYIFMCSFKWNFAIKHFVYYASQCPKIRCWKSTTMIQHLRRNIKCCADKRSFPFHFLIFWQYLILLFSYLIMYLIKIFIFILIIIYYLCLFFYLLYF